MNRRILCSIKKVILNQTEPPIIRKDAFLCQGRQVMTQLDWPSHPTVSVKEDMRSRMDFLPLTIWLDSLFRKSRGPTGVR